MAALQCDICGGKLMGRPGGIFECDSCGTQYDTAWAKEKIQEIKGTVKVEGTVQVAGTVKVDGTVKVEGNVQVEGLLKKAKLALISSRWENAAAALEEAIGIDPANGEVYLYRLMADVQIDTIEELKRACVEVDFSKDQNFQLARQYAAGEIAAFFAYLDTLDPNRFDRLQMIPRLEVRRWRIRPFRHMVASAYRGWAAVKADGTVISGQCGGYGSYWRNNNGLYNVKSIAMTMSLLAALHDDGTVTAVESNGDTCQLTGDWTNIVELGKGTSLIGIKANGTVVLGDDKKTKECAEWTDIVSATATPNYVVGVKRDGSVVAIASDLAKETQKQVEQWQNVVEVISGTSYVLGLLADGTVVAVGGGGSKCDVTGWHDIVAVATGNGSSLGLKADGTVLSTTCHESYCTDQVSSWKNVVAIAGDNTSMALTENGSVLFTGYKERNTFSNGYDKHSISQKQVFSNWKTFIQEQIKGREAVAQRLIAEAEAAAKKAEEERLAREAAEREAEEKRRAEEEQRRLEMEKQKTALSQERDALRQEQSTLKGLFTGKRRKEIEARLAQIETELKELN